MVDTLAYAKDLEGAGIDRKVAEAHVSAMTKHLLPDLVTKQDLRVEISGLEHRLFVKLVGAGLGIGGLFFALLKLT